MCASAASRAAFPESPRPIPFVRTVARFSEPGQRRLVLLWLALCLVVVPSGSLTRLFEWTGLAISLGGAEIYLTVYLPLIACVPLTLWLGYWWAAIPAYLSTFVVGVMGGMPLPWVVLFSMANPVGLAALYLAYRAYPARHDLRSASSILYYFVAILVSSQIGSVGALIWAHTNRVGANQLYPIWQGWWLGGFAQGLLLCAPLLVVATPTIERWKSSLDVQPMGEGLLRRRTVLVPAAILIATIFTYVLAVRRFTYLAFDALLASSPAAAAIRSDLENLLEGLALPQWVLLTLVAVTLVFGLRVGLTWAEQYRELAGELEQANRRLREASITDALTGVYNRAHLLEVLPREVSRSRRHGRSLACLVLDLDHFKSINDRLGHLVGDEVLKRVAAVITERVRAEDVVTRFGGEEFLILLPDSNAAGAFGVAEDIRQAIAREPFRFGRERLRVTTSGGVAELADVTGEDHVHELVDLADTALYMAKKQGRNRVVTARLNPPEPLVSVS